MRKTLYRIADAKSIIKTIECMNQLSIVALLEVNQNVELVLEDGRITGYLM